MWGCMGEAAESLSTMDLMHLTDWRNGIRVVFVLMGTLPAFCAAPISVAQTPDVLAAAPPAAERMIVPAVEPSTAFMAADSDTLAWWREASQNPTLHKQRFVAFDLPTVLIDTLANSPMIQTVQESASIKLEQIIQQDAAFDSRYVLDAGYDQTNDPVGNALVTGGPPRLRERSWAFNGGVRRTARTGTQIDLTQELGLLDSNSQFFEPADQGNARLSLSLTQPLMAGRGRVFNERLLVQAKLDSRIAWQQMQRDVSDRITEVISAYLLLYQRRCHLIQQDELIRRGQNIERVLRGRSDFDVSQLELTKLRQRVSSRNDERLQLDAGVQRQQATLRNLIGSDELNVAPLSLELIPDAPPSTAHRPITLAEAMRVGMESRPEIRMAMEDIQSAALGIQVTRNQLMPRLDAVVNGYLAGLSGDYGVARSFGEQFYESGPGIMAGLEYELPRGNRLARSRHREAMHRYRQKSARLQEVIQDVRLEIETALIRWETAEKLRQTKRITLAAAREEEEMLTRRFAIVGADGSHAGLVLESLLESQQRRTMAERMLVSAEAEYHIAWVELQRAMGILLKREGITAVRDACNDVRFDYTQTIDASSLDLDTVTTDDEPAVIPLPLDRLESMDEPVPAEPDMRSDVFAPGSTGDSTGGYSDAVPVQVGDAQFQPIETTTAPQSGSVRSYLLMEAATADVKEGKR
ncbi:Outer membrane efflux protein [Crateriforma conspicua]|uniref:Outer membrane efflux protein n=2 Tax=Crateriforma conspicua TaxID=2527996 RepID=A0A5C5Y0V8_9PLAN|nr:Outer membrane efflux protein [Crateriforma conspicua]